MGSNFRSSGDIPRPRWLTVLGTVEGYVASGLTTVALLLPVSPGNERLVMIIIITLVGLGLGLGIGGVRFGEGAGKVAAWAAVVPLSLLFIALVIKGLWEWFDPARFL